MTTTSSMNSPEERPEGPRAGEYYGNPIPYLPIDGYPGKLIAVEGTDSVGRTTQIQLLREWLEVFSEATTRPALSNTGTASATTPMASSSSTSE